MNTFKLVTGSIIVYVAVACASSLSAGPGASAGEDSGSTPRDGSVSGSDSIGGQIIDALIDPVSEAKAQVLPPLTATETCNKTFQYMGTTTYAYAEHAFPGFTVEQLSAVRVLVTFGSDYPAAATIPGYRQSVTTPDVRDGFVALRCGTANTYSSVTFILPQ